MMQREEIINTIFALFEQKGQGAYFGEAVSETEHALQAAHLAVVAGASDEQVIAALLHDVGHLLHGMGEHIADHDIDGQHEEAGAAWLEQYFSSAITEPIRMHVPAKRYLCAVATNYLAGLSPASTKSLQLQGGPFAPAEVKAFEQQPFYQEAVALRHWDDGAKIPSWHVPGLEAYRQRLEMVLSKTTVARKDS